MHDWTCPVGNEEFDRIIYATIYTVMNYYTIFFTIYTYIIYTNI